MQGMDLLERRTMLSAAVASIDLSDEGVLQILWTNKGDEIVVQLKDESTIEATVNGTSEEFALGDVLSIDIRTFQGSDLVEISGDITVSATISTGQGSDSVTGGSGDDLIDLRQGRDYAEGSDGNDEIYGRQG